MQTLKLKIPSKLKPLFKEKKRFYFIEGGRGGAKSWSVADFILMQCMIEKKRVLCTREVQKSISESVHHLLAKKINDHKIPFKVLNTEITCPSTGSQFIFHGLRDDTAKGIKSLEDVDIAWVEEAQYVSKASLEILIPTIRKAGSILIFTYNRKEPSGDAVHDLMLSIPDEEKIHVHINYTDNPFCSEELVSEAKRSKAKAEKTGDWGEYDYVWLGKPLARKGKIFTNYRVEDFSDIKQTFDIFRHGLDWGFADDPLAYCKLYYDRRHERLYVLDELYLFGYPDSKSYPLIKALAGNDTVIADSSEPKSIQNMQSLGLNIIGAKKGPGSVETGIKFLQSLEIIVDPSCTNFLKELENYRYKQDKAGNILPEPIDAWNHCFVSGTLIETKRGQIPIEKVTHDDYVFTPIGYKKILACGLTGKRKVKDVILSNGKKLVGTGNHNVFVFGRGLVPIDGLRYADRLCTCKKNYILILMGFVIVGMANILFLLAGSKMVVKGYMLRFGNWSMDQSKKDIKSIILIMIEKITTSRIWQWLKEAPTCLTTQRKDLRTLYFLKSKLSFLKKLGRLQKNGMQAMKEGLGMLIMVESAGMARGMTLSMNAQFAKKDTYQEQLKRYFVLMLVSQLIEGLSRLTTLISSVFFVKRFLDVINIQVSKPVAVLVVIDSGQKESIYNLTVADCPAYFANGVLVKNCLDAARYSLESDMGGGYSSGMA